MEWVFKKILSAFVFLAAVQGCAEEAYQFSGEHFFASYVDCDMQALTDLDGLREALESAIVSSGATLLDACEYVFLPSGLTKVFLLSESHASIHTYPEHGACFVDLFTCGENCSAEKFHAVLCDYLKPANVSKKTFQRGYDVQETHAIQ